MKMTTFHLSMSYFLICCVNSHDIQHRVIPQDFVRHIHTQVQASICTFDSSCVAWPHLQATKVDTMDEWTRVAMI